jgi:hypothetical protein
MIPTHALPGQRPQTKYPHDMLKPMLAQTYLRGLKFSITISIARNTVQVDTTKQTAE